MAGSYADIIAKKKKEWKTDELMDGARAVRGDKIPFSSPLMNWATYGGIPENAITEFFGEEGGGKTTTAVDICKNAFEVFQQRFDAAMLLLREQLAKGQKQRAAEIEDLQERGPKRVLYVDIEHSFDGTWSKVLGIDQVDWVMQPPDVVAEDILQMILELVQTGELGLIVLDSLPSLIPKTELEKKIGEKTVAALANIWTIFLRKLVPLLARYQTTFLVINQTRDNQDNPYVVKTPGGRATKFYAQLRVYFRLGAPVDFLGNELPMQTENPAGYKVNAKLAKQKSAPWDRKLGTYFLMCTGGIRPDYDYAQLAVNKYSVIKKAGAWFTIVDPTTGEILQDERNQPVKVNGMAKVYQYLADNPEYYKKLKTFIMDDINGCSDVVEGDGGDIGGDDEGDE